MWVLEVVVCTISSVLSSLSYHLFLTHSTTKVLHSHSFSLFISPSHSFLFLCPFSNLLLILSLRPPPNLLTSSTPFSLPAPNSPDFLLRQTSLHPPLNLTSGSQLSLPAPNSHFLLPTLTSTQLTFPPPNSHFLFTALSLISSV